MKIPLCQVDAFTGALFRGNPAGLRQMNSAFRIRILPVRVYSFGLRGTRFKAWGIN